MKQQQKIENKNFFYCWICQKFEVKLLIWLLILFEISTQLLKIEEEKSKEKQQKTLKLGHINTQNLDLYLREYFRDDETNKVESQSSFNEYIIYDEYFFRVLVL